MRLSRISFYVLFLALLVVLCGVSLALADASWQRYSLLFIAVTGSLFLVAEGFLYFMPKRTEESVMLEELSEQAHRKDTIRLQGYLRSVIAHVLDGIIVLDSVGKIESLNPAAEEILNIKEEEAKSKNFEDLLEIVERTEKTTKARAYEQGTPQESEILKAVISGGLERFLELSHAKFDSEGEHFSVVVLRDVTAQQHQTNYLEAAKRQSEEAAKAKTQFLAMMSHEIRTPLNGIIGVLQLMQNAKSQENNGLYIDQGMRSAESLKNIIGDLLDISRIEAGKIVLEAEHFSPRKISEDEIALAHNLLAGKKLKLKCLVDENIPDFVDGDSGKIRQVIRNMLSNAIKFTEKGGVLLNVKAIQQSNVKQAQLLFVVKDTGIGIPEGKTDIVFNEFDSVNMAYTRRYGGAGLGMAISKGIVEAMQGKIGFTSQPGNGSSFWFHVTLPIIYAKKSYSVEQDAAALNRPLRDKRVLVVEDNATNSLIAKHMLEQAKCRVMTAVDGLEALEMLDQFTYDAVLMDVAMPRMDGLEASRKIREQGGTKAKIPIIAMTAHAAKEDVLAARNAGMSDYLTKPIDQKALLAALRKAILKPEALRPINARKPTK